MFWVASAPLTGKHINISPKGMPSATFTIFDSNHCAYVDATGSGAETIAHIYENGRVTLCWCSFDTTPRILHLYCWGRVIEHDNADFSPMLNRMGHDRVNGARAIINLRIWKVGTSCGMSVPLLELPQTTDEEAINDSSMPMETTAARYFREHNSLRRWTGNMESKQKMEGYRQLKNTTSLDGLPSLRVHRREKGCSVWMDIVRTHVIGACKETRGLLLGVLLTLVFVTVVQLVRSNH